MELKNLTAEKQLYSLRASTPPGWSVVFKPNYKQATSVEIEPNGSSSFNMEIDLLRLLPNQLFSETTQTLLTPSVRSLGPHTMQQVYGTIPAPLPLGQSILLVWPQVTGLIALTVLCFVFSYVPFIRREIRPR